jgi:hypothetical protein
MVKGYFREEMDLALSQSRERVVESLKHTLDHVYGSVDYNLIAAYENLVLSLGEAVFEGRISIGELEELADKFEADSTDETDVSEKDISRDEYFKQRRSGKSYVEIRNQYPKQSLKGYEIAYGLSRRKKSKKTKKKK